MDRKIVTLQGINRNSEVTIPDNINLLEAINVRKKDGAYRAIKTKSSYNVQQSYNEYFIHTIDTVKNWIGWRNNNLYWFTPTTETLIGSLDVDSVKIQSVGYVLVLYTKTGNNVRVYYSLFDKTTNSYGSIVDFEFEPLDVHFFTAIQKYEWIFAHRVTVDGVDRVNWLGLTYEEYAPGAFHYYVIYEHDGTEDILTMYSETGTITIVLTEFSHFAPSRIKFSSNGDTVNMYIDDANVSSVARVFTVRYNNLTDTYYGEWTNGPTNNAIIYTGAVNDIPLDSVVYDERSESVVINDTDGDGASNDLNVSAGTTIQEKYEIVEGAYLRDKSKAGKIGFFEGFTYVTYAFRLYDGSCIKYSFPRIIYAGEDFDLSEFGKIISDNVSFDGFVFKTLGMYIDISNASIIADIIAKYDKLIVSMDFFMTNPLSRFNFSNYDTFVQQGTNIKALNNQANFYLVYSIPLKDLAKYISDGQPVNGGTFLSTRNIHENRTGATLANHYNVYINSYVDINAITTFEAMPVDNFTAHVRYADSIFKYNNRLMISNTIQKLYKGFSPLWFLYADTSVTPDYVVYFETVVETTEGIKYVRSNGWSTQAAFFYMPEYFGYPDNRATKFRIIATRTSDNSTRIITEIKLTKHLTQNLSYYLAPNLYQQYILELESNNIFEINRTIRIEFSALNWNSLTTPTYPAGPLDLVIDNNKISITEVNNPFIFPAKFTYQVGDSEILGLASNADPVSQGQFGQYPIIVFTKTGIWTLNIAESDTIYISNITPLNGEVCTVKESISNIAGSVIFVSDIHIKLLKGGNIIIISDAIRGNFISKCSDNATYLQLIETNGIFDFPAALSQVKFEDYIEGAKFGYDRNNDEFIVSNSYYEYSYVFNAKYQLWYKISQSFARIVQDYPEFYGINGVTISNLSEELTNGSMIYLETQSILFSEDGFSKLDRMRLELIASNTTGSIGIYIMGSIDGEKWAIINGKEYGTGTITNPVLSKSHVSLKYLKLIISANTQSIEIRNILLDIERGFTNKIR